MTELYAVRFPDGSYMQGRKPQYDEGGFLVWTDPAHAGNAVVLQKEHGKIPEDQDYEVVKIGALVTGTCVMDAGPIWSADEPWDGDWRWNHVTQHWQAKGPKATLENAPAWVPHDATGYDGKDVERR